MKLTKSILLTSCFFLLCACGEYKLESEENETVQDEQAEARYTLQLNVTSRTMQKNQLSTYFSVRRRKQSVVRERFYRRKVNSVPYLKESIHSSCYLAPMNDYSYLLRLFPDSLYHISKTDNCSEEPLQIGKASVNLTQSTRITVILSYAVASLNFTLNGIPQM